MIQRRYSRLCGTEVWIRWTDENSILGIWSTSQVSPGEVSATDVPSSGESHPAFKK